LKFNDGESVAKHDIIDVTELVGKNAARPPAEKMNTE